MTISIRRSTNPLKKSLDQLQATIFYVLQALKGGSSRCWRAESTKFEEESLNLGELSTNLGAESTTTREKSTNFAQESTNSSSGAFSM
ncbi:hypothetical protein [Bacillus massilinigeriensis]|uniref:hypothetical protein n=1 Tax=Bacillus mediterraneensis TaxID=1805474 RepID=UPI0008F8819A|nr:hypothetical protein [Bacillus mediterraneensis]